MFQNKTSPMKTTLLKKQLFIFFSLISAISFSQSGDDCANAIPIPTLDGSNCPTVTPSTTNSLAAGTCEEGTLETWLSFTAQGTTATIGIQATTSNFDPEFLVVSEPANSCAGGTFTIEGCVDGTTSPYTTLSGTVNGLVPGNTYWVIVSSGNDVTTGTFDVCVNNPVTAANCVDNETCGTATTITLPASGGGQACVTDCNTGASNGLTFTGGGCEDQPNPVSWFSFTTDSQAASVTIDLSSTDLNDPEFTVFLGNACTTPWTITNCTEGASGNANATFNVSINQTYMVAVSDQNGATGDYTLCIEQTPDNSSCNTNNNFVVTATSLGSPLTGPYRPGEDVTICYNVINYQQVNCNYIGAFIPTFGDCWDPSSFDAQGQPINITTPLAVNGVIDPAAGFFDPWWPCAGQPAGSWNWFTAGQATYNNIVGGSYPANSPLPAGWYFLSSYDPFTGNCAPDPTDPDNTYGDGNFPACGGAANFFDYTICFTLKVKDLNDVCNNGQTICDVTFETLADAEFGAWTNLGCIADVPSTANSAAICTLPIELVEFTAEYNPVLRKVLLNWTTASEINNDKFIVERSNDGYDFKEIAVVEGAGNSVDYISYRSEDNSPMQGINFYRLKQVDFDGKTSYSEIQPINITSDNRLTLSVAPNPNNGNAEILYNAYGEETVHVIITDMNGTVVYENDYNTINGSNRFKVDLYYLKKGVYTVKVISKTRTNNTKMIIR